jgi:hypothetical protein
MNAKPMLFLLAAGLAGVLAGCGGGKGETQADLPPGESAGPLLFPNFAYAAQDTTLLSAPLTGERHRLGIAATGQALEDTPNTWAVDYTWFYLKQQPLVLRTMSEMDSIAAAGGINDSTEVGIATYRMRIPAMDLTEAQKNAESMRPPRPPEELRRVAMPRPAPPMRLDTLRTGS